MPADPGLSTTDRAEARRGAWNSLRAERAVERINGRPEKPTGDVFYAGFDAGAEWQARVLVGQQRDELDEAASAVERLEGEAEGARAEIDRLRVLEGQQGELMTALTKKVSERGYRLVFDFMPGAGWTVGAQPENWPAARRIGAGSTFEEAALEALASLGCSPEPEGEGHA